MPTKEQADAGEEVGSARVGGLGYALLCLLVRGPGTGYDLAQRLRRPIGYYWTARHTQIYPELARLVSAGLVTYQAGAGPGPREKKTYTIAEAGRDALAAWLVRPAGARGPDAPLGVLERSRVTVARRVPIFEDESGDAALGEPVGDLLALVASG